MKVMMFAPYIYDSNIPEFTRNKTGFGIMVKNILTYVDELVDTILVTRVITDGYDKNTRGYKILSHNWWQIITQAQISDWNHAIYKFFKSKGSLKERARQAFYCVDEGYIRRQLIDQRPDIVHIHGIGSITKSYISACEKVGICYIITLHGLIGLDSSIKATQDDRNMECEILKRCFEKKIPVSTISSGIKKRIEENYLKQKATNIEVILNGSSTVSYEIDKEKNNRINNLADFNVKDYLETYHRLLYSGKFPQINKTYEFLEFCKLKGKKIIISIGNITDNKNQIELVEATKRLSFDENILVVLFGNERDDQKVRKKIIDENLENTIILAGFCDNLNRFWELVDLNVLLSLNEGFGLSIIEGYMHGIPSVTFSDLDAVEDIYDSSSTILIEKRETSAVVEAIKKGLEIDWKADKIKEIGSKFSMEKIAREYVKLYNKQLGEKK